MAGHEVARYNLGLMEIKSDNMERAVKHFIIAASAGNMVWLAENQLTQLWQLTILLVWI
jgi:TPR repeat protein